MKKYLPPVIVLFLAIPLLSFSQDTQGFFLDNNRLKNAELPPFQTIKPTSSKASVYVEIDASKTIANVSSYLYGNNTNPYMTKVINQPKLMTQLKALSPTVLRFPGGNLSNVYFWDALPNTKPADVPDTILYGDDTKRKRQYFWVGRDDKGNTLSLNNYYTLLQQTNSTGSICVNVGYARYGNSENPIANAAHYAANWVRFDGGRTKFWEVGNEDYGTWQPGYKIDTSKNKDGQPEITNGALYGKIFKAYSDSMHAAAREINTVIEVGASLIEGSKKNKWDRKEEIEWDSSFFKVAGNAADFVVIHNYYTPYRRNTSAEKILASATTVSSEMMQYMKDLTTENKVELKPIALTEWNIFSEGSKQQTSYINGIHAAIVLGELAKNKYGMACRWDLANGYNNGNDHGMFNKGDEPDMPQWSARPVFYYMYYFQKFFGNKMVEASSSDANTIIYASTFSDGKKGIVLINKDTTSKTISLHTQKGNKKGTYYGYTLTGGQDNGEFSQKVIINGVAPSLPTGGPENFKDIKAWSSPFRHEIKLALPARSVNYLLIE